MQEKRNQLIRARIEKLVDLGFALKDAFRVAGKEYYLSAARVEDVWRYRKAK